MTRLLACVLLALLPASACSVADERPNVLFIVVDDLNEPEFAAPQPKPRRVVLGLRPRDILRRAKLPESLLSQENVRIDSEAYFQIVSIIFYKGKVFDFIKQGKLQQKRAIQAR